MKQKTIDNPTRKGSYSEEEKAIMIECISQYTHNLQLSFQQASYKLKGRTQAAVSAYYYHKLRKNSRALVMTTSKGSMTNTKHIKRPSVDMTRKEISAFDIAVMAIDELDTEQRKNLIRHMMKSHS